MYKTYISDFFYILKINRIMLFCNLFTGRPLYYTALMTKTTQWSHEVEEQGIKRIN